MEFRRVNAPFAVLPQPDEVGTIDDLQIARSLERRRLQCYLALVIGDVVALMSGFGLAGYLFTGVTGFSIALSAAQVLLPIFLTIAIYNRSYSIAALIDAWAGIVRGLTAMAIAVVAVQFVAFYTKSSEEFSRAILTGGAILAGWLMVWMRLQMRSFVAWRCGTTVTNVLIIDDGGPQIDVPGAIKVSASDYGLRPDLGDPHALDRVGIALRHIDRVIVSCRADDRPAWSMILKGANVDGEVLDDEVARLGAQGARVTTDGHGLLLVSAGPLGLRDRAIKRLFDVILAGGAILALSPVFVAVSIAIKLEDGGPVLFVQRRMGRGNCFFRMFKFRSMTTAMCDRDGNVSTSRNDQRVTRVGRFIRSTSIDELPQLINVLLGDMSLVGPRPHAIASQAGEKLFWEVDLRYWQRHSLKPGLSGLAQIRGYRGATDHEDDLVNRLQSDLEYLEGWTIMRDLHILFLTLRVVVHERAF